MMLRFLCAAMLALSVLVALLAATPAAAQEMLLNRSFETPVAPANGNNFYATIPEWTVTNLSSNQPQPFNIIKAWSGYANNPTVTPTGGGAQYLDINSAAGTIRQTVTITGPGMVDLGGWFSVRDYAQALGGLTINLRDGNGVIVGSASTSFAASDPIGLWKSAGAANIPVGPGTYVFEVVIPDYANFDLASLVFKPAMTLAKTAAPYADPVNGTVNPKFIPGAVVEYTLALNSPGSYTATANSIAIADATPAGMQLIVGDIGGTGSGPAAFAPGASTMTYSFAGLASTTDDVDFSNDNGASWTYAPVADANGADAAVTTIRLRPQGAMAGGSTATFRLRYRVR